MLTRNLLKTWRKEDTVAFCETKYTAGKKIRKLKPMRYRKLKLKENLSAPAKATRIKKDQDEESVILEPSEYPELLSILPSTSDPSHPQAQGILTWIEREYKSSRGFALDSFNPSILPTVFQELSIKWEHMKMQYVTKVVTMVHHFCNLY